MKLKGVIYFASNDAKRKRYYTEGQHVTLNPRDYYHFRMIVENLVNVELDSTGTNYIHIMLDES